MPISFHCPSCGQALSAPDTAAGAQGSCKFCGATLIAPSTSNDAAVLVPPEASTPAPPDSPQPGSPFSPGMGASADPSATPPGYTAPGYTPPGYQAPGAPYTPPGYANYAGPAYMTYAEPWKRLVAAIIDGILMAVVSFPIGFILGMLGATAGSSDAMGAFAQLIGAVIGAAYYIVMTASEYQGTVGKIAMGIKVTDLNGNRISGVASFLRYIGTFLSGIICLIGYIMILFTEKKQGLHDMIAGTVVIDR